MLIAGIRGLAPELTSLLDVGAGIGAIAHELLDSGLASATVIDASDAYLRVAREEAARRGRTDRYAFRHGDFLAVEGTVADVEVVTMDRVVCCYPNFDSLLDAALGHARAIFAFSYPRDRWYVRLAVAAENLLWRIRRNPFRTFVHPPPAMHAVAERHGFRLRSRQYTLAWCVDVWQRVPA